MRGLTTNFATPQKHEKAKARAQSHFGSRGSLCACFVHPACTLLGWAPRQAPGAVALEHTRQEEDKEEETDLSSL